MTFGWGPMRIVVVFAMCTCASPEVGGFQGGLKKVELLFRAVRTVQKHPIALCILVGCVAAPLCVPPQAVVCSWAHGMGQGTEGALR